MNRDSSLRYVCIATHTNCFYNFKMALYTNAVVMKGFNSSRKLV